MLDRLSGSRSLLIVMAAVTGACGGGDDSTGTEADAHLDIALTDRGADRENPRDASAEHPADLESSAEHTSEAPADATASSGDETSPDVRTDDDAPSELADDSRDSSGSDTRDGDELDVHGDGDARPTVDAASDREGDGLAATTHGDAAAAPDESVDGSALGDTLLDQSAAEERFDPPSDGEAGDHPLDEPALDAALTSSDGAPTACAPLLGTYRVSYVTRGGTCGPLADHLVTFDDGSVPGGEGDCPGTSTVSPDGCSSVFDVTCTMSGGGALRSTGVSQVVEDASRATSTQVLTVTQNANLLCTGTYDVTYVRQ